MCLFSCYTYICTFRLLFLSWSARKRCLPPSASCTNRGHKRRLPFFLPPRCLSSLVSRIGFRILPPHDHLIYVKLFAIRISRRVDHSHCLAVQSTHQVYALFLDHPFYFPEFNFCVCICARYVLICCSYPKSGV